MMSLIESTLKEIKASFGNDYVITDLESLTFYSTDVFKQADVDGALAASVFHKNVIEMAELKQTLIKQNVEIRPC